MSVHELSERTRIGASTIRAHERNQNGIKPEAAAKYAAALGVKPEFLLYGTQAGAGAATSAMRLVPVVGSVQAGIWSEIQETEPCEWVPFADPAYARANLFAVHVQGPSMNKIYTPDQAIVICAPVVEAGVVEGDHAVVRRHRHDLVETTLKEVVIGSDGRIELWPRSTDPRYQEPFILERGSETNQLGIEIIGVVVGAYRKGPARTGPRIF